MPSLEDRLAALTPAQRRLLAQRLAQQRGQMVQDEATIRPNPTDQPRSLSFAQSRQWFLQQLEPDNAAYNKFGAYRLQGPLDRAALATALQTIEQRHAILRTTYSLSDGEPLQTVATPAPDPLPVIDVAGATVDARLRAVSTAARAVASDPFDLTRAPLWRHRLYRLGPDDHVLLRVMHHIVSDRWSVGVIHRELTALYASLAAGEHPTLAPLPYQYADFATWQRQRLAGPLLAEQVDYWQNQLAGAPARLALPTDFPRGSQPHFGGAVEQVQFSAERSRALKAFSQRHGATLFMTLLSAFNVWLTRYTGATDLLVGVPIAGRIPASTAPLIGLFINTLVMRANVADRPSFTDLLAHCRQTALAAFAHQDVPFEKLVELLQPERQLGHTPLFQVLFDFLNTPMPALTLPGVRVSTLPLADTAAAHDLSLLVHDESDRLLVTVSYPADLYRPQTIQRWLGHWQTLLDGVLANPNRPITALPLLSAAERSTLVAWGSTPAPDAPFVPVQAQIADRAERSPQQTALTFAGQRWSYAALLRRAGHLSSWLHEQRIGRGQRVALLLPRSAEWIVAQLGVLLSGAAYVPLDPQAPAAHLAHQLTDSDPAIVLTAAGQVANLPAAVPFATLDAVWQRAAALPSAAPVATQPDDPAYIMYTSGTSGPPKGVVIPHRALAHFAAVARTLYAISAADRVLQFASPAFDTAVEEIYPTLLAGGTLVVRPPDLPDTFADFAAQVARDRVTVLDLPTAFWHSWLAEMAHAPAPFPTSVRLVIVGGEAAQADAYRIWRQHVGEGVRWINTYGPTETTVVATAFEPDAAAAPPSVMPIGRPLPGVTARVVDADGNAAPIGVPGELLLSGPTVGLGYWGLEGLSAESFPIIDGQRAYKTGDRVRWLPDGTLDFLGRADAQVKVRGVRVELSAVEATLQRHPDVAAAAVITQPTAAGDLQLIACIQPTAEAALDVSALRDFAAAHLLPAARPGRYLCLDTLPLTTSGKIDRQALLRHASDAVHTASAQPQTPIEQWLCDLWAETLSVPHVGLHDNFFDLGGHSLLAVQLVSRMTNLLRTSLPLRALFAAPSVAGILTHLAPDASARARLDKIAAILQQVAALSEAEAAAALDKTAANGERP